MPTQLVFECTTNIYLLND